MRFDVVVRRDEDGYYVAAVPELPGCHTQAKSLDELIIRIKEAISLYIESNHESLIHTQNYENDCSRLLF